jgi:hypothetical protein
MARQVRQTLPDPPPQYDQEYIAALARSINSFMGQATALAEVTAGRFITTDPVAVPGDLPDTTALPTGMLYLKPIMNVEDVPGTSVAQQVWATATLTLTTTQTAIPGCAITLPRDGTYLLMAAYDFNVVGNEQSATLYGSEAASPHHAAVETSSKTGRNFVYLNGIYTAGKSGQVVQSTAWKSGGSGTSYTGMECMLLALWIMAVPSGAGSNYLTVVEETDP